MGKCKTQFFLKWLIFVLAVTLWTVIIPGSAAYFNGTFYPDVVFDNLSNPSVRHKVEVDNAKREQIRTSLDAVEDRIIRWTPDQSTFTDLNSLIAQKLALEQRLIDYRNQIRVSGFIDNETTLVWWLNYFCLGSLVFFFLPRVQRKQQGVKWLLVVILAFIVFEWTNWYRNTILGQYGRTVYSYVHADIGKSTFLLQELRILGMFAFICIVWKYWWTNPDEIEIMIREDRHLANEMSEHALNLARQFQLWQRDSIFLTGAFLPWSWFYWRSLGALADPRYVFSAILLHLFWLFTWIAVTSRLWNQSMAWRRERTLILANLASKNSAKTSSDALISFIKELDPLPKFQVVLAALASLVSLLSPFIDWIL